MEKKFLSWIVFNPFLRNFIPSIDVISFIACQFALESNFGRSELAVKYHNLGGMKIPHRRFSYRSGNFKDYCVYDSTDLFILDYISWIFFNRPFQNALENLDSFKLFLRESGYCPEKDYISRIESLYNQYFVSPQN